MKFGISLPPFGDFADPEALAELAQQAELAGWDGFFIWDHMIFDPTFHPITDIWVGLAAVALKTQHIRLGTMITPLARRRPWKVARETVAVDRLSKGRLTLGVGLGDPAQWEYGFFGEERDAKIRAGKLDEALEILQGLWGGKRFSFQGEHYHLEEMQFLPTPVQQPRIPVWVAGWWPNKPPLRRAARWDGVCPGKWEGMVTPEEWRALQAYIRRFRQSEAPFDWVHSGATPGDQIAEARRILEPYVEVGISWWVETVDPWRFGWKWEDPWSPEATLRMRERVAQGPPALGTG